MKNRINLSKYHLRTDLIIDDASIKGKIIKYDNVTINKVSKDGNYIWERILVGTIFRG